MKTTEENNRLIAEFEGYKVDYGFDKKGVLFAGHHIRLNQLRYHESWDWLMPVVEKIENLEPNTRLDISRKVNGVHLVDIWQGLYCRSTAYSKDKKEATYQAVIQFIEWYNSQS